MFAGIGIHDPLRDLSLRRFCSLLEGFVLDGATGEQREKLLQALEGLSTSAADDEMDRRLAETYQGDGYSDLRIEMMEALRHEPDPVKRSQIRLNYMAKARESKDA